MAYKGYRSSKSFRGGSKSKGPVQKREFAIDLAQVLPEVMEQLGWDRKVGEISLFQLWSRVVPQELLAVTRPTRLERRVEADKEHVRLWVAADNGPVASELGFLVDQICEKLNTYAPQTGIRVDGIRITVDR